MKNNIVKHDSAGRVISVEKYDGAGRTMLVRRVRHTLRGSTTVTDRYGVDGRVLRRYVTKRSRSGRLICKKIIRENGKRTFTLRDLKI